MELKLLIVLSIIALVRGDELTEANVESTTSTGEARASEIKIFLREKCLNATGSDTKAEEDIASLKECMDKEPVAVEGEISNNNVYSINCRKYYQKFGCIKNFTIAMEPCMDEQERAQKDIVISMSSNLLEFGCQNDAENIASLMTRDGIQCVYQSRKGLKACMTSFFGNDSLNELKMEDLWKLMLHRDICIDMKRHNDCVVKELEECQGAAVSNLIRSMYKHSIKDTSCNKIDNQIVTNTIDTE